MGAGRVADGFKLPRIRAADTISDKAGKAANAFVRFWDTVMKAIERQENAQTDVLTQLAQVQATQAQQLILIYQALELAGIAIEAIGDAGAVAGGGGVGEMAHGVLSLAWLRSSGPLQRRSP